MTDRSPRGVLYPARLAGLATLALLVIRRGTLGLRENENDVLPVARHFVQPSWIAHDWYLGRPSPYRALFDVLAGPLVVGLGFSWGALVGRMVCAAAFAWGVSALCAALELSLARGLVVAAVSASGLSLGAGEWMTGAIEAKAFAYPCVLLALAALLGRSTRRAALLLGLALSFHVLVGLQAIFCLGSAALATPELRRPALRAAPLGLATGLPGIAALALHARSGLGSAAAEGARIYVDIRVPHHVNVDATWFALAAGLVLLTGACFAVRRDASCRLLAAVALAMVPLAAAGLLAQSAGWAGLQKLYWYRFADVMLPFVGALGAMRAAAPWESRAPVATARLGVAALLVAAVGSARDRRVEPRSPAVNAWIREHTDRDAIFLIDPSWQSFYVTAERAQFVTFKQFPQEDADVVEWFARLTAITGTPPSTRGFDVGHEAGAALARLPAPTLRELARRYDLSYLVAPATPPREGLEAVYSDGVYQVLDLRGGPSSALDRP